MASAKQARELRGGLAGENPGVLCPKCGTDVMETGWTESAVQTASYMRFRGRGAVLIASTVAAADKAECMCCGAKLGFTPVELQRVA